MSPVQGHLDHTFAPLHWVHQIGCYRRLKTMNLEGKRDHSSAYVKDENGVLVRDIESIRKP